MDDIEWAIEQSGLGIEKGYDDNLEDEEPRDIRYRISSYGADPEVETLVQRLDKDTYTIPDYQRGYVWSQNRASQFIESLLLGLPVPGIFLYRDSATKRFLVIDGHQRLRSLHGFYQGQFPGTQKLFILKGVDSRFEGRTYLNLSEEDRIALDTAVIHATIIEQEEPDEDEKSSIYQIFRRINSGAVPLSPHEIRYCVSYGVLGKSIKEWNMYGPWRVLVGKVNPRMKDQELILRFFALLFSWREYRAPMQGYLDRFLDEYRDATEINGVSMEWIFKETTGRIFALLGDGACRIGRAINVAFLDAVMVATAIGVLESRLVSSSEYDFGYLRLLADHDFVQAISRATARPDNVSLRIEKALQQLTLGGE